VRDYPDDWVFWPHEPPEDAVFLVRAVGTDHVTKVQYALSAWDGPSTAGGSHKDDVTFFVPRDRREEAEKFVKAKLAGGTTT